MTDCMMYEFILINTSYMCFITSFNTRALATPSVIQVLVGQPNLWDDPKAAGNITSNLSIVQSQVN